MYKKISISLMAIVALLLLLPGPMGYLTYRKMNQIVTKYSTRPELKIEIQKYQRGWFRSRGVLVFHIQNNSQSSEEPISFTVGLKVIHGPVIMDIRDWANTHLKIGQSSIQGNIKIETDKQKNLPLSTNTKLNIEGLINLSGSSRIDLVSSELEYKNPRENLDALIKGMRIKMAISRDVTTIETKQAYEQIFVEKNRLKFHLSNTNINSDHYQGTYGLWFGTLAVNIPFSTIAVDGKDKVIVNEINFRSSNSAQGNVVNLVFDLMIDKIIYDQTSYGPGDFHIAISNLDAQVLGEINDLFKSWASQPNHTIDQNMQIQSRLIELTPPLISRGFQLRLNPFAIRLPEGELSVQAWLTMPNVHRQKNTLKKLLKKSDSAFVLVVPKVLFEKAVKTRMTKKYGEEKAPEMTKQKIAGLLADNLLVEELDSYRFLLAYNNEKFYLTGKVYDKKLPENAKLYNLLQYGTALFTD